jgi:YHS domain-containing protein
MKARLILLSLLVAALPLTACKKRQAPSQMNMPNIQSEQKQATTQSVSQDVTDFIPAQDQYDSVSQCPVNGEKVTVGKGTSAVKYKGKVYYMCCPACVGQFKANPEKYAK